MATAGAGPPVLPQAGRRPRARRTYNLATSLRQRTRAASSVVVAHQRAVAHNCSFVRRLALGKTLRLHSGCVNTIEFDEGGQFLLSGSDDTRVGLWSAYTRNMLKCIVTGHIRNIFDAKFVPFTGCQQVVTCAMDGQVRLHSLDRPEAARVLHDINSMKLRVEFVPNTPTAFLSTSADSVALLDLRQPEDSVELLHSRESMPCVAFDPFHDTMYAMAESTNTVRLYDLRFARKGVFEAERQWATTAVSEWSPPDMDYTGGVSSLEFSAVAAGELLINYRDGDVVLSDTNLWGSSTSTTSSASSTTSSSSSSSSSSATGSSATGSSAMTGARSGGGSAAQGGEGGDGALLMRYTGRTNSQTFAKQARFLLGSTFVGTGCDRGLFHIWHKATGVRVRAANADSVIVNCVTPHPHLPMIATSGIDNDIKWWQCSDDYYSHEMSGLVGAVGGDDGEDLPESVFSGFGLAARQDRALRIVSVETAEMLLEACGSLRQAVNTMFKAEEYPDALAGYQGIVGKLRFRAPSDGLATRLADQVVKLQVNIAACCHHLGLHEESIAAANRAIEIDPHNTKAWYRAAQGHVTLGQLGEALACAESGLDGAPQNSALLRIKRMVDGHRATSQRHAVRTLRTMFS